ncbi:hypothetical protein NPIL_664861 [Nephila pilipes]|uniref:Uncharacterized protein n=1 Tax=Nephila pilipes TaxID=299642 RepID=A0A8X6QFH2_NEPPI|nr:hypothetical protein NPIL_664861 [Nephila pilipes]
MRVIEDFNAVPSLCFILGNQIVISLWNRKEVMNFFRMYLDQGTLDQSGDILLRAVRRVRGKVKCIAEIPFSVRDDIIQVVYQIGYDIFSIVHFLGIKPDYNSRGLVFPMNYWTVYGTIDSKRLNLAVIDDYRYGVCDRFSKACQSYRIASATALWNELNFAQRQRFRQYSRTYPLEAYFSFVFTKYLPCHLKVRCEALFESGLHFIGLQFLFMFSLDKGYKRAIEYFLHKLTPDEYKAVLKKWPGYPDVSKWDNDLCEYKSFRRPRATSLSIDALYFSLAKLKKDERNKIIDAYGDEFLRAFLNYPFYGVWSKYLDDFLPYLEPNEVLYQINVCLYMALRPKRRFGIDLEYELKQKAGMAKLNEVGEFLVDNLRDPLSSGFMNYFVYVRRPRES